MQARIIRIGTRGSPLALAQANDVSQRLQHAHNLPASHFEIAVIRTSGDRIQDRPLSEAGGKGLFTKEIEEALIAGSIDLAVHSMKDMPALLPSGLEVSSILPKEDVRDAFISLKYASLDALPPNAALGTSSLRRAAQVLHARPDLRIVPFRGNVGTRLRKLEAGVADATLLAAAGLNRLGLSDHIKALIPVDVMLPAVAQGAVGIEIRSDHLVMRDLVSAIEHAPSAIEVSAERAFLARLEGSCRTPIGGLARLQGSTLVLDGQILTPDGRESLLTRRQGHPADAVRIGEDAAEDLLARAGPHFFEGLS